MLRRFKDNELRSNKAKQKLLTVGNDNLAPAFLYFEVAFGSTAALFVSLGKKTLKHLYHSEKK